MLKYTVRITWCLLLCGASGRMEFGSNIHRVQTVRGCGLGKQRLPCICKRNRNNGLLLKKNHTTCMFHFPFARALTCRNRASSNNSDLLSFHKHYSVVLQAQQSTRDVSQRTRPVNPGLGVASPCALPSRRGSSCWSRFPLRSSPKSCKAPGCPGLS